MESVSRVMIVTRDAFKTLFVIIVENFTPLAFAPRT